ncbi:hypothetical protein RchiOBHm_Chr1g0341451 [Rosa chinensis]|uniref:Uncharacterized protein n=1 Tax=Rosa chinensis TaxID=74649 RepID=A0A2P6SDR8_ROSCH|nr:hypothetical protein RchiOBHm_Chr1g0341451 [Rosa chinensis]
MGQHIPLLLGAKPMNIVYLYEAVEQMKKKIHWGQLPPLVPTCVRQCSWSTIHVSNSLGINFDCSVATLPVIVKFYHFTYK